MRPVPAPPAAVDRRRPTIGRIALEGIRDGRFPPPATATLLDLDLTDVGDGTTGRTVAHAVATVVDDAGREYVHATAVIHLAQP